MLIEIADNQKRLNEFGNYSPIAYVIIPIAHLKDPKENYCCQGRHLVLMVLILQKINEFREMKPINYEQFSSQ